MIQEIPTIFAIKRYALHDGPQIRTTIFLKGCPLSCLWCHNPEGLAREVEIITNRDRCIGCGECLELCPEKALSLDSQGIGRNRSLCTNCGICVDSCPALAHEATGRQTDVEVVMTEIKKDLPFYDTSGGGVTFSGGEPLLQPGFLLDLLRACGDLQIHRTVDTSGFSPTATLLEVARHTELFLYDLKHMESAVHKRYTGVGNELILDNLTALCRAGHVVRVRVPLVAGVNDDETNIRRMAGFLASLTGIEGIDLLPYHSIGRGKYRKLEMTYGGCDLQPPDPRHIKKLIEILSTSGFDVRLGG
jgi:pyruvate formate lyase activating enzyme